MRTQLSERSQPTLRSFPGWLLQRCGCAPVAESKGVVLGDSSTPPSSAASSGLGRRLELAVYGAEVATSRFLAERLL